MDYELFHDESMVQGYWHGMLLVPNDKKLSLVSYLNSVRSNINYESPIGIKKVRRYPGKIFDLVQSWISISVASMMSVQKRQQSETVFLGEKENGEKILEDFAEHIGAKFVLFRERDAFMKMKGHKDFGSKSETTIRMGIKGGLHRLFSDDKPVRITRFHFDGNDHYGRSIDKERIIGRMYGLREYCTIVDSMEVIDDRSSDHRRENCQDYGDCQLLQLTDLLIGGFRSQLGFSTKDVHIKYSLQLKALIKREQQGYARMKNSRWFNSFCLSECYLEENSWHFKSLSLASKDKSSQLKLLDI